MYKELPFDQYYYMYIGNLHPITIKALLDVLVSNYGYTHNLSVLPALLVYGKFITLNYFDGPGKITYTTVKTKEEYLQSRPGNLIEIYPQLIIPISVDSIKILEI